MKKIKFDIEINTLEGHETELVTSSPPISLTGQPVYYINTEEELLEEFIKYTSRYEKWKFMF